MFTFRSRHFAARRAGGRWAIVGPAMIATAALATACGGPSGVHRAAPLQSPSTASTRAPGSTKPTRPAPRASTTTVPPADLAALKQQLNAAGSSLGAAGTALSQSDPDQTKNSEGTTP